MAQSAIYSAFDELTILTYSLLLMEDKVSFLYDSPSLVLIPITIVRTRERAKVNIPIAAIIIGVRTRITSDLFCLTSITAIEANEIISKTIAAVLDE